jgi:hypothetical protein
VTDVVGALPPNLFVDWGFWDAQLLLPIWMWIIIIMVFVGFWVFVGMLYIWFIMRPVSGYGNVGDNADTAKGSPTQVFSIWKNRSFVIESLWYYGNVLAYGSPTNKMQMWFHNSEKATGISAGKPVMITRDGFDGTVDLIAEMGVCAIPQIFNRDWGMELVPMLDDKKVPVIDPETNKPYMVERERVDRDGRPYALTNYRDIMYRLATLMKLYPKGAPVGIYKIYDLAEIYKFTPKGRDSLKFGGIVVDDALEWAQNNEDEDEGFLSRNSMFLMCLLLGLVSAAFCFFAFPVK